MKKINWSMVAVFLIVVLLVFMIGTSLLGGWGYRGYSGMMGGYGGMMGNWGYFPFGWFGMGLGMLFMWLIPVSVIVLIVYGIVALTRNAGTPPQSLAPCPNCGRGTQSDWKNCPYCGTTLK